MSEEQDQAIRKFPDVINAYFLSLVEGRRFSKKKYAAVRLWLSSVEGHDEYIERINAHMASIGCEDFKCFMRDSDDGIESELLIPHFYYEGGYALEDDGKESMLAAYSYVEVLGYLGTIPDLFDGLHPMLNPLGLMKMKADQRRFDIFPYEILEEGAKV